MSDRQILTVEQQGSRAVAYGEGRGFLFAQEGQLQGYTSTSLTVKGNDGRNKTYGVWGNFLF